MHGEKPTLPNALRHTCIKYGYLLYIRQTTQMKDITNPEGNLILKDLNALSSSGVGELDIR